MGPFRPLLPLLLSAMTTSAVALVADCAPASSPPEDPVPWVRSWMPPVLHHQISALFPQNDTHQAYGGTALDSGSEQPLEEATGDGKDPAFCPL
ncbi:MAG: hypothetical protein TE42_00475 [Candidatus Synechococcus spongiarum SP3]|uniref:Secreted protein n=1 Tax=Candidatus Synechococcus spongiarum SP3 TaxID=1604020 RepID=A0A0G2IX77_9SYNE|nr:MAG: hypothetical protein TE42_00475 [Candidatus Synechococcus spongiarum SP3]